MSLPPPTERQARLIWLAITGLAVAVLIGLGAALVWGLGRIVQVLSPVLWPLAIAGVISYLLDPVVHYLERKSLSRPLANVMVFLVGLVITVTLFSSELRLLSAAP